MFLPVEQVSEAVGEEVELDLHLIDEGTELDTAEDWAVEDSDDNVEKAQHEMTNGQVEHTTIEDMEMEERKMSGEGQRNASVTGDNFPQCPSSPRPGAHQKVYPVSYKS